MQQKTYIDERCGFKFTYSAMWSVTTGSESTNQSACDYEIKLTKKSAKGGALEARVQVSLEDHEFVGFEQERDNSALRAEDGHWKVDGGHGLGDAEVIHGANWIGLNVPDLPMRCYADHGTYSGAGSGPEALLFSQRLHRMAWLAGQACGNTDVEGVRIMLATFKFLPPTRH